MITIPEAVKRIVTSSPFLDDALSQGIINYSALARQLQPVIKKELMKDVQEGAILMALRRMSNKKTPGSSLKQIFTANPDIIIRSNLMEVTVHTTNLFSKKQRQLIDLAAENNYFLTISQGVFETTIIASKELKSAVMQMLEHERVLGQFENLSSLTIKLPVETVESPGVYYFILKLLAWEGIPVTEVVSTYTELTIILQSRDIDRAFSIIKKALSS